MTAFPPATGAGTAVPEQRVLERGYDYLLSMPLWSLTLERVEELRRQESKKRGELEVLQRTDPKQMWTSDLADLERALDEFEAADPRSSDALTDSSSASSSSSSSTSSSLPKKKKPTTQTNKKKKASSSSSSSASASASAKKKPSKRTS
jgi:DNA topoisomerase II